MRKSRRPALAENRPLPIWLGAAAQLRQTGLLLPLRVRGDLELTVWGTSETSQPTKPTFAVPARLQR